MFKNTFKAIDNLFSTKHDLLAIGLFLGASIALMLSEALNWVLNNNIAQGLSTDGFWFAVISVFVLFLKLLSIAFVLFGIDWLYNKFVRKSSKSTDIKHIKQEMVTSIALEDSRDFSFNDTKEVMNKDNEGHSGDLMPELTASELTASELITSELTASELTASELTASEFTTPAPESTASVLTATQSEMGTELTSTQGFIAEYIQDHDDEFTNNELDIETQDLFSVKYQKYKEKDQLLDEFKLVEIEQPLNDQGVSASKIEKQNLITILRKDLRDSSAIENFQQQFSSKTVNADVNPEHVRSILARQ